MVHVCAMDRDKVPNKEMVGKMVKHMMERDRTEDMKAHIILYPLRRI